MKYKIITDVLKDGLILQRLNFNASYNQNEDIGRWVIDTRESSLIEALVLLGWTPPDKKI